MSSEQLATGLLGELAQLSSENIRTGKIFQKITLVNYWNQVRV